MSEAPSHMYPVDPRNRLQRSPRRGSYDREPIHALIDAAPICHVGFVADGEPFVIPTIHARCGDELLFHGSAQSRMMQALASGAPICATFTFLDGIVAARSAMHHSMNYRSVVAFGEGRLVEDPEEKRAAFELTVEKLLPGRWENCRQPNDAEDKATAIAAVRIRQASLKQRSGGPVDIESDYGGPHWAGVIPIASSFGAPIPCERLPEGARVPGHIARLARSGRAG